MSALFGIAQADGSIPDLDAKLGDALPDYFTGGQHDDKKDITLRHLLQMRSGIQFDEGAHNDEWLRSAPMPLNSFWPGPDRIRARLPGGSPAR